jgi:non-ribosomal peptide synthase protein (TIGR01720 family)
MYILDPQLNPVPVGVSGEIYIGGVGLARGYLNRPQLTAEKFIPNPFNHNLQDGKNLRLYCTGDLGCYLPDGNIEFLGRRDDQVKLRGYRIELGEIESAIADHEKVSQVVVIARNDEPGRKKLVAYIVPKAKEEDAFALAEDLRQHLNTVLPEYMVPSFFVCLTEIPLTHNGKIDRKALPSPDFSTRSLENKYIAPRNEHEQLLSEIWSAVLGIERVGIKDHFFRMGGDSIVSIQLVSKARQKGLVFSVKDVFNHPTIETLAAVVQYVKESKIPEQDIVSGAVPLTPIQHWFFSQNPVDPHHYNQVMWIKNKESVDLDRLQNALKLVYQYHDGFRLRYRKGEKGWEQYYAEDSLFPWKVYQNIAEEDLGNVCTELQSSLNIEQGPLSQLVWFTEQGQLLWIIHHLVVDGVSWRILLEDLNLAYAGKSLGFKSHSFKNWSDSLSRYEAVNEIEYYQTQLSTIPRLPSDHVYNDYVALKDVQGLSITFSLQTTKRFLQKAHQSYGTQPDDLLLLALTQAAGDCFGQYQLCVDLEGHGREDLGEDLDLTRTLGWFTSMHPVVLTLSAPSDLDHSIKYIKEHLRHIPQKGVSYGILSQIQKTCTVIQGDVLFNYLGQWSNGERNENTFFFEEGDTGLGASLENAHSHPLIINGGVNQGQLGFHWTYSMLHYKAETIEKFSRVFKERLETLIDYCAEEKHFGYTPSDFPHIKLQAKQLDKLLKKLGSENNA